MHALPNQVTILIGETGSGKSTQMLPFLAEVECVLKIACLL